MLNMYYDTDCDLNLLKGKTVAIIGYGSQGHAHALNLKESGVNVVVGLRPDSASVAKAKEAGLTVCDTAEAAKQGDIIMILTPDQLQPDIYHKDIEPNLQEGNILMFAHGFAIHSEECGCFHVRSKRPGTYSPQPVPGRQRRTFFNRHPSGLFR